MSPFFVAAAMSATAPALAQSVPSPAVRVGDVREFQGIDDWTSQVRFEERQEVIGTVPEFVRLRTEVKATNPRTRLLEPRSPEEETVRADLNVDYVSKTGTSRRVNYAWPLEAGKKWDYKYELQSIGNDGQPVLTNVQMAAEVSGWETVITPAGSFRAIKVVHRGTAEMPAYPAAPSKVAWTLWYAPEVASQVKVTYQWDAPSGAPGTRTTLLLTSYKRAPN